MIRLTSLFFFTCLSRLHPTPSLPLPFTHHANPTLPLHHLLHSTPLPTPQKPHPTIIPNPSQSIPNTISQSPRRSHGLHSHVTNLQALKLAPNQDRRLRLFLFSSNSWSCDKKAQRASKKATQELKGNPS